MLDHRFVYKNDVALFALLATPGVNSLLLEWLLSFGNEAVATEWLTPFIGLAGSIGLGFAWLRLRAEDSRVMLGASLLVKVLAGSWLITIGVSGLSPAFYLFGALDLASAGLLLVFLLRG